MKRCERYGARGDCSLSKQEQKEAKINGKIINAFVNKFWISHMRRDDASPSCSANPSFKQENGHLSAFMQTGQWCLVRQTGYEQPHWPPR